MTTFETILLAVLACTTITGGLLAFFYRKDRERKKRKIKRLSGLLCVAQQENHGLKDELAALNESLTREQADRVAAEAKATHAEIKAAALEGASDYILKRWLEQLYPPLAVAETPDLEKAQWLREWVHLNIPGAVLECCLDANGHYEVYQWSASAILAELARTGKGFLCAGTSVFLRKLYDMFKLPACTYNMSCGIADLVSHMVTLVAVKHAGREIWVMQDAFFNHTLVTSTGEPVDVRSLLHRLSVGHRAGINTRIETLPKPHVLKATHGLEASRMLQAGAQWLGQMEDRICLRATLTLDSWLAQHVKEYQWLIQKTGHNDPLFLFLYPFNIDGDVRFQSLFQAASQAQKTLQTARTPLCIIYAKGKTGTQTLEQTVRASDWQGRVIRTHFLSRAGIGTRARTVEKKEDPAFLEAMEKQLQEAVMCRAAYRQQLRTNANSVNAPRPKIISAVREPIGCMIASLFQVLTLLFEGGRKPKTVSEIRTCILDQYAKVKDDLKAPISAYRRFHPAYSWFSQEIVPVLGLDIYSVPFDTTRGWKNYILPQADLLVIRQENFDSLASVLGQFLEIPAPRLVNTNIGAQKPYAELYLACKNELKFPRAFVDAWYVTQQAQHFYTAQELAAFRAHWVEHGS